jgi:hypothetical protein
VEGEAGRAREDLVARQPIRRGPDGGREVAQAQRHAARLARNRDVPAQAHGRLVARVARALDVDADGPRRVGAQDQADRLGPTQVGRAAGEGQAQRGPLREAVGSGARVVAELEVEAQVRAAGERMPEPEAVRDPRARIPARLDAPPQGSVDRRLEVVARVRVEDERLDRAVAGQGLAASAQARERVEHPLELGLPDGGRGAVRVARHVGRQERAPGEQLRAQPPEVEGTLQHLGHRGAEALARDGRERGHEAVAARMPDRTPLPGERPLVAGRAGVAPVARQEERVEEAQRVVEIPGHQPEAAPRLLGVPVEVVVRAGGPVAVPGGDPVPVADQAVRGHVAHEMVGVGPALEHRRELVRLRPGEVAGEADDRGVVVGLAPVRAQARLVVGRVGGRGPGLLVEEAVVEVEAQVGEAGVDRLDDREDALVLAVHGEPRVGRARRRDAGVREDAVGEALAHEAPVAQHGVEVQALEAEEAAPLVVAVEADLHRELRARGLPVPEAAPERPGGALEAHPHEAERDPLDREPGRRPALLPGALAQPPPAGRRHLEREGADRAVREDVGLVHDRDGLGPGRAGGGRPSARRSEEQGQGREGGELGSAAAHGGSVRPARGGADGPTTLFGRGRAGHEATAGADCQPGARSRTI